MTAQLTVPTHGIGFVDITSEAEAFLADAGAREGALQWAYVSGLDPEARDPLYFTEPFCGILSDVALPAAGAPEFLEAATKFMNDRLWGTLTAAIFVHPSVEADARGAAALDRALVDLRYGTVGINHWPALGYALVAPPWGGHPSSTALDIQSGLGWVHNSFLIEGIEKAVVRGPLVAKPKPAWFYDNRRTHELAPKLIRFELGPSWLRVPSLAFTALQG